MADPRPIDLHPWNTGFRWRSPSGHLRVLTPAQAEQFDREGFVVLDDVFTTDEIERIREEIDAIEAGTEAFLRGLDGQRLAIAEADAITFSPHLVVGSPTLRRFAHHPVFAGLCHDLVGPDVNLYWDQAVYKKPAKPRRFPWHQDNGYAFVRPQQYLTCWLALSDATEANGCPQVARGAHRRGTLRHTWVEPLGWECLRDPDDVAVAEVAAGGLVVFSSLTPHLTGPNTTATVRKAYILQYAPAGAAVLGGRPEGTPTATPADHPDRQFPILRHGRGVPHDG